MFSHKPDGPQRAVPSWTCTYATRRAAAAAEPRCLRRDVDHWIRCMGSQPSAPAASAAAHADAGTYVAASSDIADGGRIQRCVQGRYVTILRVRGVLRAIDSICFHAGGELVGSNDVVGNRS
eukprot:366363-Chlamydomonas_euryale.AAC.15